MKVYNLLFCMVVLSNHFNSALQFVEFSTGDDDDRFDAEDVLREDDKLRDSLEVKLMEKTKRLENDYTQLKVSFAETEKELKSKAQLYEELKQKNEELAQLVQKLEEDLLRMGTQKPAFVEELTRTASMTSLAAAAEQSTKARTPDCGGSPRVSYDASSAVANNKDDKSILPIVMNQRDRFRQRNTELEEQIRALQAKLQDVQSEAESLKTDNLKLYERLRFIHVWKEEQSAGLTVTLTKLRRLGILY